MEKVNISLAGCGFLGIYHVGVASCIKEYAPHLLLNKISGASIGALAGCYLLADVCLGNFTSEMLHIIYEIRRRPLGPFNPLVNMQSMLRNILINVLPKNAYEKVSGRLFISMTRVHDGRNCIVSEFKSNEELIEVLLASAFVPFFSGFIPPKVGEYRYIDGGFSNNLPILDENTITVSPFCGESDICPRDSTLQLFHINLYNTSLEVSKPNIYRFARILFPPSPETLSQMCKQGFDDALRFLQRNKMISCTRCLTVQRTIKLPTVSKRKKKHDQHETYDPQCEECVHHVKDASVSKLPEPVTKIFEKSIEIANRELASWLFKHKSMKLVSVVSLPYLITADFMIALLKYFAKATPRVMGYVAEYCKQLLELLIKAFDKMNNVGSFLTAKVLGPSAISAYISENRNDSPSEEIFLTEKEDNLDLDIDFNVVIKTMETDEAEPEKSFVLNAAELTTSHDDTYDNLLQTIDDHEALMAFYYMDDSNKMNVVEFFNVTQDEAESSHATNAEKEDNDDGSICSTADLNDQMNVSSDPESEWSRTNDPVTLDNENPECEQHLKKNSTTRSSITIK